ncbi:hypothetical protein [Pseudomonas sp. W5-01]|uniref:hypothetical protein n=1 Tax=Pseudomonas sp. W5-01 TaxID=3097454 RepID=UPI00397A363C
MTFVELCLKGDALEEEIDQFVEAWHDGRQGADLALHEYLGMRWEKYQVWSTTPSVLPLVLAAHRFGTSLEDQLPQDTFTIAERARALSEAAKIEPRLSNIGKIS